MERKLFCIEESQRMDVKGKVENHYFAANVITDRVSGFYNDH